LEWYSLWKNVLLAHERLAIVDPASGNQPIYSDDKNLILAANGEIYNHQELRSNLKSEYAFKLVLIVKLF